MSQYTVVIRCKNEARWLPDLKKGLDLQCPKPKTVVFVDNGSKDGSLEFAESAGWIVVNYPKNEPFNYSRSLNIGIEKCETEYVLLLSAHCLLVNKRSVDFLLSAAIRHSSAGVFGRQLPTRQSDPVDVRDLLTVFGREEVVYRKHPFFHNAFSLIRKDVWQLNRFDEQINGIEDRLWAKQVCSQGYKIVYEPRASVYHEHGLNQSLCKNRTSRVLKALLHLHVDDDFMCAFNSISHGSDQEHWIEYDSCLPFRFCETGSWER